MSKTDLLDWAETLLCNGVCPSHCTPKEWDEAIIAWRDAKHKREWYRRMRAKVRAATRGIAGGCR